MIFIDRSNSSNFVRNSKYVVWKGFEVVFDKPCTKLSTVSVDNNENCLIRQWVMTSEIGALAQNGAAG
jgi:hypothetical protein